MKPGALCVAALIALSLASCANTVLNERLRAAASNQNAGDYAEAEHYHRIALESMKEMPDISLDVLASQTANLASSIMLQERYDEALAYTTQSVTLIGVMANPGEKNTWHVMIAHGINLALNNRPKEAERHCFNYLNVVSSDKQFDWGFRMAANWCMAIVSLREGNAVAGDEYFRAFQSIAASSLSGQADGLKQMEEMYARQKSLAAGPVTVPESER
jgi:hypothetical protein